MGARPVRALAAAALLANLAGCGPGEAEAPEGMRLVGLGHVFVPVPDSWGFNAHHCGVPQRDTALVDVSTVGLCGPLREPGVESVRVDEGEAQFDHRADEHVTVDGVRAERSRTRCGSIVAEDAQAPGWGGGPVVCSASLYFPTYSIGVYADSSTSAHAVDQIIARVRVLPEAVGVPEVDQLIEAERERSAETYRRRLEMYGLSANVIEGERRELPAGQLLSVMPNPGTVLRPGDAVTVFVNTPARKRS